MSFKSNRNRQFDKKEKDTKNSSQSQNKQLVRKNNPFSIINQTESNEKEKPKNTLNNYNTSKTKKTKLIRKKRII